MMLYTSFRFIWIVNEFIYVGVCRISFLVHIPTKTITDSGRVRQAVSILLFICLFQIFMSRKNLQKLSKKS